MKAGICPKCGKEGSLLYDCAEIVDDGLTYPYECSNCSFEGKECYDLEFAYHLDAGTGEIIKEQVESPI